MPVEFVADVDIGLNPEFPNLNSVQWSMRLNRSSASLSNVVRWLYTMPRLGSGAEMRLPHFPAPGPGNIALTWESRALPHRSGTALPQCLPEIPGWLPVFLQPVPIYAHSGIWQRREGERTLRAIVLFDGRCDVLAQGHSQYAILASGPILWRYVEVRAGFHEGPSVAFSSEAGTGDILTLAVTNLPREALVRVYPNLGREQR